MMTGLSKVPCSSRERTFVLSYSASSDMMLLHLSTIEEAFDGSINEQMDSSYYMHLISALPYPREMGKAPIVSARILEGPIMWLQTEKMAIVYSNLEQAEQFTYSLLSLSEFGPDINPRRPLKVNILPEEQGRLLLRGERIDGNGKCCG